MDKSVKTFHENKKMRENPSKYKMWPTKDAVTGQKLFHPQIQRKKRSATPNLDNRSLNQSYFDASSTEPQRPSRLNIGEYLYENAKVQ